MNLLAINDLSAAQIKEILDLTDNVSRWALMGRTIANVFYEPSTRTRLSFELAAKRTGAEVITFDPESSSELKGEEMKDTVLTIQAMGVQAIVMRHPGWGIPRGVASYLHCSVINAGDGSNEHPTQALLDLYTMRRYFGQIAGLRVGIVGDVKHSRVAHSLYPALAKMGAITTLIGPRGVVSSRPGPYVSYDLDAMLPKLDVCYMLRAQKERWNGASPQYSLSDYALTQERADKLPKHAVVMHPGPMNRNVEIDGDVADSSLSLILDQVSNGVKVRSALLYWLLTRRN